MRTQHAPGFAQGLLLGLLVLPMAAVALLAARAGASMDAWRAWFDHPGALRALAHALAIGWAATALASFATAWILSRCFATRAWDSMVRRLSPMLAVPHAAFAVGAVLLLAPSGWALRLVSPGFTGFSDPPAWASVGDPWGLGLIAVLVGKEVPFLLWAAAAASQRADLGQRWQRELAAAQTMGYSREAGFWHVVWPQWRPKLLLPFLAVLAYGSTVVDLALIIGPQSPPTLPVQAWAWLNDAEPHVQAQGAAAAWGLVFALLLSVGAAGALGVALRPVLRRARSLGRRSPALRARVAPLSGPPLLAGLYWVLLIPLLLASFMGPWPFPDLLPQSLSFAAWSQVARSADAWALSLGLACASALAATVLSVATLEWLSPEARSWVEPAMLVPLALPGVLWAVGTHRLMLAAQLDAHGLGLWAAHTLTVLPYVWLTLSGAYLGFDARLVAVAQSLGASRLRVLWRIKWPLLKSALLGAFAVGFASSIAQYLVTLSVGAGRFVTVTTEAVSLSSGGARNAMAAFAVLQMALPMLVFAASAWLGRPRFEPLQYPARHAHGA